jgi:hypothetical protein
MTKMQDCAVCGSPWGWCTHSPSVDVDGEIMQLICTKAGETTSMIDPYDLLKFKDFTYG